MYRERIQAAAEKGWQEFIRLYPDYNTPEEAAKYKIAFCDGAKFGATIASEFDKLD